MALRHRFLAALLGAGVLALAFTGASLACSCVMPEALGAYVARDPTTAVFAGTAGPTTRDRTAFTVERWFAGPGAAPVVLLVPGTVDLGNGQSISNTCGLDLPAGSSWVLAAPRGPDGSFTPSVCLPHAGLGTEEGAALLAEAERTFGPGTVPEAPPLASPAPTAPSAPADLVPLAFPVLVIAAAAVLLVGGVALARRVGH